MSGQLFSEKDANAFIRADFSRKKYYDLYSGRIYPKFSCDCVEGRILYHLTVSSPGVYPTPRVCAWA